ncbi:hypothetical protein GLOTRDRAFT_96050 [Gloeophyllum trabeum ATCC 11539]|uniref:Uncharacterized protein n=1 Tax=Gloeophyllum trabeum (strain ATCC 11539 / FP-39264 / Madison 617) TaxID=670483 RepID=S7PW85_GLOTA|nr:uncharacterized protein GLOTRDRAFT_96050 [Gloeophyllum trabeum ATCC 11539]EPQ51783.1 hypothetical protein GLOTRDRAFT_96050 [Gloeophyllum trabeum ATCC 11539]
MLTLPLRRSVDVTARRRKDLPIALPWGYALFACHLARELGLKFLNACADRQFTIKLDLRCADEFSISAKKCTPSCQSRWKLVKRSHEVPAHELQRQWLDVPVGESENPDLQRESSLQVYSQIIAIGTHAGLKPDECLRVVDVAGGLWRCSASEDSGSAAEVIFPRDRPSSCSHIHRRGLAIL